MRNNGSMITNAAQFATMARNAGATLGGGLIANSTLLHEQYQEIDATVSTIALEQLFGITDLMSAGLVRDLKGLGTSLSLVQVVGDLTDATVDMAFETKAQNDSLAFEMRGYPVPVIHYDFNVDLRSSKASENGGTEIGMVQAEVAARKVAETIERSMFKGHPGLVVAGHTAPGILTHPDRNKVVLSGGGWAVEAGRDIIGDVKNMLQTLHDAHYFGPYTMYVANDVWIELDMDYSKVKGDKTYMERIKSFASMQSIRPSSNLEAGEVVILQKTSDVIDLARAADIQSLKWDSNAGNTMYKVYGAMVVRVKSTALKQSGIVHGSAVVA